MNINFVSPEEVIAFHQRIIRSTGGAAGKIDRERVEAMILRVQNLYFYENITDIYELAAAYMLAIARGHVFVDGNKRASLFATIVFLKRNGIALSQSLYIVEVTVDAAAGLLNRHELADILRVNCTKS